MPSLSPLNQRVLRSLPLYGTQTVMSTLPPLNRRAHNLVLLFSVRARSSYYHVSQSPLNIELRAWCLLVDHVQSVTSELTSAQIQFTLAVPSGLAIMLTL